MQQCESEAKIKHIEKKNINKPKKIKEQKSSIQKIVETEKIEKKENKQEIDKKVNEIQEKEEKVKEANTKEDANIYESIMKKIDEDHDLDENDIDQYLN